MELTFSTPVVHLLICSFILGWCGRVIQGGQLALFTKMRYGRRPLAYSMYAISFLGAFWMLFGLNSLSELASVDPAIIWPAMLVVIALVLPHLGPSHGKAMDMGRNGGTLKGDFRQMFIRFLIPAMGVWALLNFVIFPGELRIFALALLLVAAVVPAGVYALCWYINENVWPWWEPTVWAERIYASTYQTLATLAIFAAAECHGLACHIT